MRNGKGIWLAALLVSGCASNPDKLDAAYVSPVKYEQYNCPQIATEMDYVGQRTTKLHQRLESERTADNWQMGVGLVLFWPSLFFLEGGDGPEAAEYSQLKGEYEALRQTSVAKQCGIASRSPDEIMKDADKAGKERTGNATPTASTSSRSSASAQRSLASADVNTRSAEGKNQFSAQKISKTAGCETPELISSTASTETYQAACDDGKVELINCEFTNCRLMK